MTIFTDKAPKIMQQLMHDFHLTKEQSAGILGNIGHECMGFLALQEIDPVGEGGLGWCQWTGPRRTKFENWCQQNNLTTASDEGNYGFLKHDLSNDYSYSLVHLRKTTDYMTATVVFEEYYEYAGVKNYPSRQKYALEALNAYKLVVSN